ncbi:hypothetical protein MTO96_032862 [Rhipicephalus appendiculatus]
MAFGNLAKRVANKATLLTARLSRSWRRSLGSTVGEKSSTTRSVCQLVKGFGVTSTVSPGERTVRRLCDEVAEEDARPTPLSVELVGVVRPVRPSVFRDWQLSSLFGKRGDCCHHATRAEQTVRDVVAEVIVRAGVRKWFHFPWTPDEKGAFKKVSWAAGVIGCVDGSVGRNHSTEGRPSQGGVLFLQEALRTHRHARLRRRHGNIVVNHCVWGQQTTCASGGQRGCGSDSKGARIAATIPFRHNGSQEMLKRASNAFGSRTQALDFIDKLPTVLLDKIT